MTLTCVLDEAMRVGVDAATYRRVAKAKGAIAALELHAARSHEPIQWVEGPTRASHGVDELTMIVVHVGYATTERPPDEAGREAAKEFLASRILADYLEQLDEYELALEAAKEKLPKHLRNQPAPDDPPAPIDPDDPPAPDRGPQRRLL